jgi:hypothetical protein
MYSPVDFTSSNDFKTTLLYAFRPKEKESSYLESIVQRRGWLDSILLGLQLLFLFFSSYRVHGDDMTGQHQWIVRTALLRSCWRYGAFSILPTFFLTGP